MFRIIRFDTFANHLRLFIGQFSGYYNYSLSMDSKNTMEMINQEKVKNTKSLAKKLLVFTFALMAYQAAFSDQAVTNDAFSFTHLAYTQSEVLMGELASKDQTVMHSEEPLKLTFEFSLNLDLGKTVNRFVSRLLSK